MTWNELDALINKATTNSELTAEEQFNLGWELSIYRSMALRLERTLHKMIKETETIDNAI